MAVTFRAVGSWENGATGLTADEVLSVPAAQVTGDMVVVLASWKDFGITAQVSGYTEITEFADGSVGTGNGLGSMKVGAWYKEATSDTESDPTLDFSTTTGLLGEGTIIVFAKASGETWLTPTFVTAAWPNQSAGTVSASSTITVPNSGAVIGLFGIRDDSATVTRGTNGIDDSAGSITWNGNYVESPATHASTTTGNDMAVDAGYRLVTTGGTGITLRQSSTALSATETGAMLWVVLGATTLVQPSKATLTITMGTPTVTVSANQTVTPSAASLTITAGTPTVSAPAVSTPSKATLVISTGTPVVTAPAVSAPSKATLTLTTGTPFVEASSGGGATVVPTAASLTITTGTPTVTAPAVTVPSKATLTITGATPTVTAPAVSVPSKATLTLTGAAPTILVGQVMTPALIALAWTGVAPVVLTSNHQLIIPDPAGLTLTGRVPFVAGDVVAGDADEPLSNVLLAMRRARRRRQEETPDISKPEPILAGGSGADLFDEEDEADALAILLGL